MALISPKILHCGQAGVQAESEVAPVAPLQADPAGLDWRSAKPLCLEACRGQGSLLWPPVGTQELREDEESAAPLPTADPRLAAQLNVILESQGHRPIFPPGTQPSFREPLGALSAASPCWSPSKPLCCDAYL